MAEYHSLFALEDSEIERHIKKQAERRVVNMKLRDDNTGFFQAMSSDDANYIAKGVVSQEDLKQAFRAKEE